MTSRYSDVQKNDILIDDGWIGRLVEDTETHVLILWTWGHELIEEWFPKNRECYYPLYTRKN